MKFRVTRAKMRTFTVRALSFSAVAALTLNPALTPVVASDYRVAAPTVADGDMNARFLSLGIGKSIVVDLPRDIKDVLVADPKIANAVVRSSQRAYIIGAAVGQTNIVFFDSAGLQIAAYDIAVKRDLNGVRAALKQTLPNSDIQIDGLGDSVILTGTAASPIEAQQAGELAARLAGGAEKVVNSITVRGRDQVMLKVTVAEVQRSIIKQMGIDLSASMNYGTAVVKFNNVNPFTANSAPLVPTNTLTTSFGSTPTVQATLRAMESAGVVRTLAEPNLTAISGESATFISGGEFPIPTGVTCQTTASGAVGNCVQTVSFKKFGISLNFTPVVLTEGRISLRVMTEVSEVSNDNDHASHGRCRWNDNSLDQDPPRGNHPGNSLGRRDGDGGPDPGSDQAGDQRNARTDAASDPGIAVPQPRLCQQPDRADGAGDALYRSRGGAEGPVAARRWVCGDVGPAGRSVGQRQSHLRRARPHRAAGPQLPRRLRLHHRLRRDEDENDDSQNIPSIAVAPSARRAR